MAVTARLTQPPVDVSAMDGYALRASDGTLGARLAGHRRRAGRPSIRRARWPRPGCPAIHRQRVTDWRRRHPDPGRRRSATATRSRSTRRSPPGGIFAVPGRILAGRRRGRARRTPTYCARHRAGRGGQPSLAHCASPASRRHPGDRRRNRHARRADPRRRNSQLQLPCAGGAGAGWRRRSRSCCRWRSTTADAIAASAEADAQGWICW